MNKTTTIIVLIVAFVLIMLYDFILALVGRWDITVSATIYDVSKSNPIIPFLIGLCVGHLIWPIQKDNQ